MPKAIFHSSPGAILHLLDPFGHGAADVAGSRRQMSKSQSRLHLGASRSNKVSSFRRGRILAIEDKLILEAVCSRRTGC